MYKEHEIKDLLLSLIKADTEREITDALKKYGLHQNRSAWRDFGDKENNYSVIGNQQSLPEVAMVEKIVNSIDSILTLKCVERGYDPESSSSPTPQSLSAAVEDFYGIKNGRLTEFTSTERSKLAEKSIGIVASGKMPGEGYASYSIFDFGEGQTPERIPDTFMSIGAANKIKIPFVQGKFNQGGTGVFRFGAEDACQLLLTKRNPSLLKEGESNKWGFSVVKRIQEPGHKSSKYVYLVNPEFVNPAENNVFSFDEDQLDILPGKFPEKFGRKMEFGTYIKLYEYKLDGYKTNITLDLYNRLSLLLPSLPIPVRMYERRKPYGKKANSLETTLNGLSIRLEEDRGNNLESENWPVSTSLNLYNTTIPIKIYAFKQTEGGKATQKYTKSEGVIFTINGQNHGNFKKTIFKRKSVNLNNLSDSLIVLVDCSNMSTKMREDLFMTSRDRLSESGELRKLLERSIEKLLKDHDGLKELRQERHQQSIADKLGDSKPLENVISNLMSKSPSLSTLFIKGTRINNPFNLKPGKSKKTFEGKEFPSFFELDKDYPKNKPRIFPNNNDKLIVRFKTDVRNDYFDRDKDRGNYSLKINGETFDGNYFINLWNGTATLNIELKQTFYIDDLIRIESEVSDVSNALESFKGEFFVMVTDPVKRSPENNPGNRTKPSERGEGDSKAPDLLGLPDVIEVEKGDHNWESKGFNDLTALKYENLGEDGKSFFVNMNNKYLLNEIKHNKKIVPKIVQDQYKYANTLIALSMIKSEEQGELKLNEDDPIDELIDEATSSISMVLIPMITELGSLNVED